MTYNQKDLIKMVAEKSGYYQNAVKDVFDATNEIIEELMVHAIYDEIKKESVKIKLFNGLTLGTKFYPEKNAMNPKTGEKIVVEPHFYPYAKYSQAYALNIREKCAKVEAANDN